MNFSKLTLSASMCLLHNDDLIDYGRFLTIVECRWGGRRSVIIILEVVEGKGWRKMAMELHEVHDIVGKTGIKELEGVGWNYQTKTIQRKA